MDTERKNSPSYRPSGWPVPLPPLLAEAELPVGVDDQESWELKNQKLQATVKISASVHQCLDLAGVAKAALAGTLEMLGMPAGMILLADREAGVLCVQEHRGLAEPFIRAYLDRPLPLSDAVFGQVASSGIPLIRTRHNHDADPVLPRLEWDRVVLWPLRAKDQVIGIMAAMGQDAQNALAEDPDFLNAIGRSIGTALDNARRYDTLRSRATALEQLVEELQGKSQEQEAFVHMASHGLKNPLVSIRGFISELKQECYAQLNDLGQFYVSRIDANAEMMERQIHGLLELSRVKQADWAREIVDIPALVREMLDEMDYQIEHIGPEIQLVNLENLRIYAHRNLLKQVLVNLVDNALRYRREEGRLRIEIGLEDAGRCWRLFVRDNGVGIAPESQQRIFNIFEQIPESRSLNPRGTGVGLAIVKQIIECHGGQVWVTSELGCGSTFYCTLPKSASSIASVARAVGL